MLFAAVLFLLVGNIYGQRVNGGLGAWEDTSVCSATCGEGTKSQQRLCNNPTPSGGGDPCDPELATQRTIECFIVACPSPCAIQKPCDCSGVTRYTTSTVPDTNLNAFPEVSLTDFDFARQFLRIWSKDNFDAFCKQAQCDNAQLQAAVTNTTIYVDRIMEFDSRFMETLDNLKMVIECNEVPAIEGQLWDVYDVLCEHGVAINEIKRDLEYKRTLFQEELNRCTENTWFGNMIQTFHKSF